MSSLRPTRGLRCIDWCLTRGPTWTHRSTVDLGSDHLAMLYCRNCPATAPRPTHRKRITTTVTLAAFKQEVESSLITTLPGPAVWPLLSTTYEATTPLITVGGNQRHEWWTQALTDLRKRRMHAYNRLMQAQRYTHQRTHLPMTLPPSAAAFDHDLRATAKPLAEAYKAIDTDYQKTIGQARRKYYNTVAIANTYAFWQFYRHRVKLKSGHCHPDVQADTVADFFAHIQQGPTLIGNFGRSGGWQFPQMTLQDLNYVVHRHNGSTAPGPSGLTKNHFRLLDDAAKQKLVDSYNHILLTGQYPTEWKTSNITPIYKGGGKRDDPSNYRPVSVLSLEAKLLDTFLERSLRQHLECSGGLPDVQHGYRRERSCQTCLATLNNDIYEALADHQEVIICKLDIAKAFDTLPPRLIMEELQQCGVGPSACRLLTSYLTGRNFRVKLGGQLTTPRAIHRGIPQGSALGPLLYIVATRGVATLGLAGKLHIYADDIVLTYACSPATETEVRSAIVRDLETLDRWYAAQEMALQHQKTQFSAIAPPGALRRLAATPILHNNISSLIKGAIVILGITFDHYLTFAAHVRALLRKLANYATPFRRLSRYISLKEKRRLVVMCLLPILDYGLSNWAPIRSTDRKQIYRKTNQLIRMLLHLHPRTRMTPIYRRLAILQPDDHMAKRIAETLALRIRKGDFRLKREAVDTHRSDRKYFCMLPNVRKRCARRTGNFRDIAWWNSLPTELRKITSECGECGVVCTHFREHLSTLHLGAHYANFMRQI